MHWISLEAKATELEACSMILKSTSNLGQNNKKLQIQMKINLQIQRTKNKNSEPHSQVNHPLVQNVVAAVSKVLLIGTVKEHIITVNKERIMLIKWR